MKWRIPTLALMGLVMACAVNAGLIVAIATELVSDPFTELEKANWKPNVSSSIVDAANRKPIGAYAQILARPAFYKSREPYVPPPPLPQPVMAAAPSPMIVDPGLVLGGVMLKSNTKKAYLFTRSSTEGAWTAEGSEFMGWKVRSISGTGAKLEQSGRSINLQLYPSN